MTCKRDGTEDSGSSGRTQIVALNSDLQNLYGDGFYDVFGDLVTNGAAILVAAGVTPTNGDTTDIAAGRIPRSLMAVDLLHLNDITYNTSQRR